MSGAETASPRTRCECGAGVSAASGAAQVHRSVKARHQKWRSVCSRAWGMAERLEGASILSFAVDQWTDVPRCRHHVMSRLARQNRVLFTSPPWSVRDIHRSDTRGQGLLHKAGDNLFTHTPPRWLPYTYRPAVADRMLRRGRTLLLNRMLRRLGMTRPIVYLWHPSFADTIDGIDRSLLVYHCYDEY